MTKTHLASHGDHDPVRVVHRVQVVVVEDRLESLDERGEAQREQEHQGADGADHLQVGKGDNNVVVEVLHLHPAPPKSVPQAGLATLASGQVAPLRPRDQGHQQREHVVHILQIFLIKATFDLFSPHLI